MKESLMFLPSFILIRLGRDAKISISDQSWIFCAVMGRGKDILRFLFQKYKIRFTGKKLPL